MSKTIHSSDADFKKDVLDSKVPVLVDFWAEWCGPCKMIAPALEELADEYEGKVKIVKINADENAEFAAKYQIRGIPTLLFVKNGEVAKQLIGAHAKTRIASELQGFIA